MTHQTKMTSERISEFQVFIRLLMAGAYVGILLAPAVSWLGYTSAGALLSLISLIALVISFTYGEFNER